MKMEIEIENPFVKYLYILYCVFSILRIEETDEFPSFDLQTVMFMTAVQISATMHRSSYKKITETKERCSQRYNNISESGQLSSATEINFSLYLLCAPLLHIPMLDRNGNRNVLLDNDRTWTDTETEMY